MPEIEEKRIEYDPSVIKWLKSKGEKIYNWFTEESTKKAFTNAGIILCHDEFSGDYAQKLYEDAINEKDPKVKEKQDLIIATPSLATICALPGAKWVAVATAGFEIPKAIKKGYKASKEHNYHELYDQMAGGIFSSLGLLGLKKPKTSFLVKGVPSKYPQHVSTTSVEVFPPHNAVFTDLSSKKSASSKISKTDIINQLEEARKFLENNNVADAQLRANRVANKLSKKYHDFKGVDIQVGANNVDAKIAFNPNLSSKGLYTPLDNNTALITINNSYNPKQQMLSSFHEGLHRSGYGAASGMSAKTKFYYGPTSYFNDWRARLLLKPVDDLTDINQIRKHSYLTIISDVGNEFHVNMATIGKQLGLKPESVYPGAKELNKMLKTFKQKDPDKAKILDLLKTDSNGDLLYPGYVWRTLTGTFKNGGKI